MIDLRAIVAAVKINANHERVGDLAVNIAEAATRYALRPPVRPGTAGRYNGFMSQPALCVLCRARPVDPRWRPFCGERCRNEDLARWAEGRYHVAGDPVPSPDGDEES